MEHMVNGAYLDSVWCESVCELIGSVHWILKLKKRERNNQVRFLWIENLIWFFSFIDFVRIDHTTNSFCLLICTSNGMWISFHCSLLSVLKFFDWISHDTSLEGILRVNPTCYTSSIYIYKQHTYLEYEEIWVISYNNLMPRDGVLCVSCRRAGQEKLRTSKFHVDKRHQALMLKIKNTCHLDAKTPLRDDAA